jgi:preprotein translocase subunit SecY
MRSPRTFRAGRQPRALNSVFSSEGAGLVNVLNLLSGGALITSVLANGVYPYITASIIIPC